MKFDIPKIVKELKLAEYAPEFGEKVLHVWVNPPRKLLSDFQQNPTGEGVINLVSELWSQGPEDTHWSPEEVTTLIEATIETDPALFRWMRDKTIEMVGEHRNAAKKA